MRVLIAGGAGFLGSHLCEELLAKGHEVICVDNLITGRLSNVAPMASAHGFTFLVRDIVEGIPALPRVDRVYHLASPASPPAYQLHAIQTLRANSEGTLNLLNLARKSKARLLFASTSEVYGEPLEHPQNETYRGNVSSTGPRSMYDEGKRYGEALTMEFARNRAVDARIARIFNTYGPRSDPLDGRMVPNFAVQALRNEPMTINGGGSQTRSLCFVSDLVRGLVRCMESDQAFGEVINLGDPEEHTVLEYARLIRELAGSNSALVAAPAVPDDPQRRRPDIHKAQRLLDWQPVVPLREGLAETISYFRRELSMEGGPVIAQHGERADDHGHHPERSLVGRT